uniref:Uncharacterized protein n=1 Tax=Solanum lycopersicum TaxID=4081 RepID=A0A3Q7J924_SOLLC
MCWARSNSQMISQLGRLRLFTGLNCVGVVEDFKFNTEEPNRLIVQYFGGNEIIHKSDLFDRFNGKVWVDNDDDAIKFSINKVLITDGQYYRLCGMPVVFQIWIYECMGKRQTNFARKISDRIPRILNWQTVGAKPRFKTLMKDTFNDGNREKNVVPSLMEIVVLQLPPEEPYRDIDEQALSGQNSDDDFVNPPPPSMKVTGHDAAIRKEFTKLAQLIPLKLTMYDYYKNRGLDRSFSQEENELFEIVFIDNIPQQIDDSLYVALCNYAKQKQDNRAISESEAPPRHAMPQFVRVMSAPIEIQ